MLSAKAAKRRNRKASIANGTATVTQLRKTASNNILFDNFRVSLPTYMVATFTKAIFLD